MTKAKDKPAAEAPAALSSLADLAAAPYNPRTISAKALAGLGYSLAEFGDISGIVWNQRTGQLVAGHQRVRSLRQQYGDLRIEAGEILTPEGHRFGVRVVDWPEAKEKAANVAANNRAIAGTFDSGIDELLQQIEADSADLFSGAQFNDVLLWEPDVEALERLGKEAESSSLRDSLKGALTGEKGKPRKAMVTAFFLLDDAEEIEKILVDTTNRLGKSRAEIIREAFDAIRPA